MNTDALLEKAAGMTPAQGAEALARAAAARRARPKAAGIAPETLRNLAIGAGIGAGGMGLAGLATGRRRKAVMRDMLLGAGLGAGVGAAAKPLSHAYEAWQEPVATPAENLARWDEKIPLMKAVQRAVGLGVPDEAPDTSAGGELVAGAGLGRLAGGGVNRVASNNALTAGATIAAGLGEANHMRLERQMRPIAETLHGLRQQAASLAGATDAADIATRRTVTDAIKHIEQNYKMHPWQLSVGGSSPEARWNATRPQVLGGRRVVTSDARLPHMFVARQAGAQAIGANEKLLTENAAFKRLFKPEGYGKVRATRAAMPLILRAFLGG